MNDIKKNMLIGEIGTRSVFIELEYARKQNKNRLSICGNIVRTSAGQCSDTIREAITAGEFTPAKDWDIEKVKTLLTVWDSWHLNDMHPECEHQNNLGWLQLATEKIRTYHFRLNPETSAKKSQLEEEALGRARSVEQGRSLGFYAQERAIMRLEQFIKQDSPELGELARYYIPCSDALGSYFAPYEEKARGWVNYPEHSLGLLGKPCPECGYKYGTEWKHVEVPEDIINFLRTLPETSKRSPNW